MGMTTAEELLELVKTDPQAVVERGLSYLSQLGDAEAGERSMAWRAMALGARLSDIGMSIEYAEEAVRAAESGGVEQMRLMGLLTLSGSLAIGGDLDRALSVIDQGVEASCEESMRARFTYQRGAVLINLGRPGEAVGAIESVLGTFRRLDDRSSVVLALNQLGWLNTTLGRLEEAESYLAEAHDLVSEMGDRAGLPGIQHNLGLLAAYQGEIPTALARLQASDDMYMEISGAEAPQHVARCEVLLGVGRFQEASDLARQIADWNNRTGDREHEANALLVAAQASLLLGKTTEAASLADRAAVLFDEDLTAPRAIEAKRVGLEARFRAEGASPRLMDEAAALGRVLEGQLVAASQANLLAARIALALDQPERAERFLAPVSSVTTGPVELRIQARLARALQRVSRGDGRGAAAAARSGLDLVDRYQRVLGATDLRIGLERHGAELGDIGLGLALESGRPRRILDWMELTRARALRHRPVIPVGDDEVTGLLGELRRVESELRSPDARIDSALQAERRRLQERITRVDRARSGAVDEETEFSVDRLVDELGDRALLEIADHRGTLVSILVRQSRARFVELGAAEPVVAELGHIRFGMRRAARLGRPFGAGELGRIDRMLFDGVELGDEVVIVPPPSLMAAPWAAMPTLRGRTLAIGPSAELWWRARSRPANLNRVLVAGGPDLSIAEAEVAAVGELYAGANVLGPRAAVKEVRSGLDGAGVAHIACHATFRSDNPMFSSLRLGDGDLNVYDIERLQAPPSMVVLSACDSGYTETRPGDELAGLTSALLSLGTRSVVASVGLVPDRPATSDLMLGFHRGLIEGLEPAAALARVQKERLDDPEGFVAAASFVCVGA